MRSHRLCVSLLFILMVLMVAFLTRNIARAYSIPRYWGTNSATYSWDSTLPTSFRTPSNVGAYQWTQVTTSSWSWFYHSSSANKVKYGGIDGAGGYAATTIEYPGSGTITSMEIKYDSAENWYTGSGTPGANQVDLRSVTAHEFGHALGMEHTQSGYCPWDSTQATMCSGIILGTTWKRSLAQDDKNGVSAGYP